MENIETMEQPLEVCEAKVDEPIAEEEGNDSTTSNSSTYGKFKDATSLLNAYESLEKEFTKKSQKLAELLKANQFSEKPTIQESVENTNQSIFKQNLSGELYKQSNWQTNVNAFFTDVPDAKNYSSEIAKIIMSDSELAKSKDCLKYAYLKAINADKDVKPAYSLDNPKYFDEIINNPKVKNKIIKDYLMSIKSNQSNLKFISGEPNNISPTPPPDKPKNLKEASNILKKLLQS